MSDLLALDSYGLIIHLPGNGLAMVATDKGRIGCVFIGKIVRQSANSWHAFKSRDLIHVLRIEAVPKVFTTELHASNYLIKEAQSKATKFTRTMPKGLTDAWGI